MTGNTVFIGHLYNTYNYYKKGDLVNSFYQEKMTSEEAKKFLEENKIDYVFYGPGEKMTGSLEKYDFLKEVFRTRTQLFLRPNKNEASRPVLKTRPAPMVCLGRATRESREQISPLP